MTSPELWSDYSEYLIHFTRSTETESSVAVLLRILASGRLRRAQEPSGAARRMNMLGDSQRCVSLSEIPPGAWSRLVENRSLHGIAFSKQRIIDDGGAPVWYLERDSPVQQIAFDLFSTTHAPDSAHPIWKLTPFIDYPGNYGEAQYRYEWEREWRIPGDLVFSTRDVAFLLVPEGEHTAVKNFFGLAREEGTGPFYDCPLVDPLWEPELVLDVIGGSTA